MYIKTVAGSGSVSSRWKNTAELYIKTGASIWSRVKQGYIKVSATTWKRFFNEANLPVQVTGPTIRSENTSGTGTIYDGPVATSPQFLNANLFGKDGTYSNYTSITARRFSYADTLDSAIRTTLVFDDRFSSAGGVTTANRTALDGKYLFYEVQVNNGTGDDFINPVSSPKKMIKSYPVLTNMGWTGVEQVGTQLTLNYTIENYYYNKIDPDLSYVRWWRSSTADEGGTLIKEETISATSTGATSTSRTGTSLYTPVTADIGYYIVAEITGRSSHTEHYGYTDNYMMGTFPTGGVIGTAMNIINVNFTDSNDRSGKNARDNLVTATPTTLNWNVTGISPSTTYRVRYRVLNNQNGLYYNPFSAVQAAASSAWEVYEDNYNGTGNISSVSISGSTATLYDVFTINETFNGSTYDGGLSRYSFEYELSVVHNGLRRYWVYPNSMSSSQSHDYWDIDPTTNPSISASPATISPGGTVTFSGTFNSYPAGLNSYPHSYKIVYGTSPATDSGWITLSSGTANQTYTNTKVYSTAGSYSAYIETTPSYTINSASVTVANQLTAPTLNSVTPGPQGGLVEANFTGGSGPVYQMFWWGTATAPTTAVTPDGTPRTFSPLQDSTGPSGTGTFYMYVRSVLTAGETSVGPSSLASAWSNGIAFNMTSTAVSQNTAPTTRATSTFSTSTVKYLDSITWSAGTYTNAASITSVLIYSTVTSNLVAPGGNTLSSFRTANPYTIVPSDPAGTPYVFAVRDTVVGTNGTTYYFYSNQITSANADAVAFSYGTATSQSGGWTASINSGAQTGATYSITSGTGSINSSTGQVTVTGLGSNVTTSVTVTKSVSGYNSTTAPASGTSATVVTYTLTYSANGGSTTPLPGSGASGSTITLASGAGTRSGFTFGGWNIGGVTYSAGGSYTFGAANATATAIWNANFVAPTAPAPSWSSGSNFQRISGSSILRWYTDYPGISGSGSITGMDFEIRTTAGGGTLLASGTRAYPGAGSYPYSGGGTIWAFRCGTSDGDISYSASARFARARVRMLGTNGTTYFGTWSGWI
jgi:hypothetical protein